MLQRLLCTQNRGPAISRSIEGARRAAAAGVLAAVCCLLALPSHSAQAQETGWQIDAFGAVITVRADGVVEVAESIDVDFDGLNKHGIYRDIPVAYEYDDTHNRVIEIRLRSVTDGEGEEIPTKTSREGANLHIRIGDADRTVSGRQSYRLSYEVRGALNSLPDQDELYWNVTGLEWAVPIVHCMARVDVPAGSLQQSACYEGWKGATSSCSASITEASSANFLATSQLDRGQGMTVVVGLAKGAVQVPEPILERKTRTPLEYFDISRHSLLGSLAALVIGAAVIARTWWRQGRDRRFTSMYYLTDKDEQETRPIGGRDEVVVEYKPPEGLRPAEIGLLLDERADTKDVTATIVDLAVRGYLTITELPEASGIGRFFSEKDWLLTRKKQDTSELTEYERLAFDGLFAEGDEVKLSDLKDEYYTTLSQVADELYYSATERGWFRGNPESARNKWLVLAFLVAAGGVALTVALGHLAGLGLVGLPLIPLGLAMIPLSRAMASRSAVGSELLRRALGFREYMVTAEQDRQRFFEQANIFSEYLPYAIVFGCVERWAKAFEGIEAATAATAGWYIGGAYANPLAFSGAVEGLNSEVSHAIASTPAASGSSGFGGGGFSGGGFGGGGGGSW